MKYFELTLILLMSLISGYGQNVLDGTYIKSRIENVDLTDDCGITEFYSDSKIDTLITWASVLKDQESIKPKKVPFNEDLFLFIELNKNIDFIEGKSTFIPNSMIYRMDLNACSIDTLYQQIRIDSTFNFPVEDYIQPFYFKKIEVTNSEYREFVNWVRDSIAKSMIGGEHYRFNSIKHTDKLNWDVKIDWKDSLTLDKIGELYLPQGERFYSRKEIDSKKLNYLFYEIKDGNRVESALNVYPDTLAWVHNFSYAYNQPLTQQYFWHPAYNHFPVVGISFYQAKAFAHWKTKQVQKMFDEKGIKYKVKIDLPTQAQWEMVTTASVIDKNIRVYPETYRLIEDDSWITDLSLKSTEIEKRIKEKDTLKRVQRLDLTYTTYRRPNLLDNNLNKLSKLSNGNKHAFIEDGSLHTRIVAALTNCKKCPNHYLNVDELEVYDIGGNVSEWIDESYQKSYKPLFDSLQVLRQNSGQKDLQLLSEIEKYYDARNDSTGMLVRGSNWYDERYAYKLGKNVAGTNAKVFLDPNKSRCTVGFRYVINVYPKEE